MINAELYKNTTVDKYFSGIDFEKTKETIEKETGEEINLEKTKNDILEMKQEIEDQ
jgi:hypothetical protein